MKTRRIWLYLFVLAAAAASAPAAAPTLAAAKKDALKDAKQKCAHNAQAAAPGEGHVAVEARKTVYERCMKRAGFYSEPTFGTKQSSHP